MIRPLASLLFALLILAPVQVLAQEQINSFNVVIEVETDGDIVVTETINVTAEGSAIRRGIFRDLPRYHENEGARLRYNYEVLSVTRNGAEEPFDTETDGNAFRIRIGDASVFLDHGAHEYELRYVVPNQVRYFDGYDEVYWNATGTYWAFPIKQARAEIVLPPGGRVTQNAAYTGARGDAGSDYTYRAEGDRHIFETTRALGAREGMTVSIGFEKGLIDPPTDAERGWLWWQRNGALTLLLASLGGVFWFLYRSFSRVGRDPPKPPVFPRYEAPQGLSPAAVHHIYHRALSGHQALIATLMNLAVKGRLSIDADKKTTKLIKAENAPDPVGVSEEDLALERGLFRTTNTKSLGKQYDHGFTALYASFRRKLGQKYGSTYFKWNIGYTLAAIGLSVLAFFIAASQATQWSIWLTLGIVAFAALNLVFMYLMPAPTPLGQQVRTEIEGFKLYLETAEKLQLNAAEVGGEAPPPMTTERYERFLPYAVALGVEEPWTRHFERLIPQEAQNYSPRWTNLDSGSSRSLAGLNSALVSNMSSGVVSAMPQSSGSSGSGGGGSSGGGGGGGGGGGW